MKWDGELYLELHNGTYTTMAEVKKYNRNTEILFRDVEILSSIASLIEQPEDEKYSYELKEITEMWRTFLYD